MFEGYIGGRATDDDGTTADSACDTEVSFHGRALWRASLRHFLGDEPVA